MEENPYTALNQVEYGERYTALVERYENIKKGLDEINDKRLERSAKRNIIEEFIDTLEKSNELLDQFDEELWNATVETVRVNSEHNITLGFKDGMELEWKI